VHVPDRRVPQAQGVDREFGARLGGEKGGDGLGGGRQGGPAVGRTPFGEPRNAGTVGAARVFRTRGAPVVALPLNLRRTVAENQWVGIALNLRNCRLNKEFSLARCR
jgi:hypothetical protein